MIAKSSIDVLGDLTLEQKVSLLSGTTYWRTSAIPEHGIKAIKFTDGPNGARGESIHEPTKAFCFPCGACVGATFSPALVEKMGVALAKDCKLKNAGVVLGPTINLHRSPLGGRNFEAYSEDPTLSGLLAAAYVNGVQSQGVSACPKHFVGNECETNRKLSNTIVDERALRELYAYAFQLTLKHSDPWCIMSSYNKVNGTFMSEHKELLQGLLRGEWNFEGCIVSDFEGVYSLKSSIEGGVNLEMPGPPLYRGKNLLSAVQDGEIPETQIDFLTKPVIELAAKVGMTDEGKPEVAPEDTETSSLLRSIATEGIVLLKNEGGLLPILPSTTRKIAVFGSPAESPVIHGGGSASLRASYIIDPLQALKRVYGEDRITYNTGAPIFKKIPAPPISKIKTMESKQPGIDCYWYNGTVIGEKLVHREVLQTTRTLLIEPRIKRLQPQHCSRMTFNLTPSTSGLHTFGVTACGETVLRVNGEELLRHAGFDDVKVEYIMQPGNFEVQADLHMNAGEDYEIIVDTQSTRAPPPSPIFAITPQATQVGFYENLRAPNLEKIRDIAMNSDVSIVFTANNKEYESESFDRDNMALNASQEELVRVVAESSCKTILVNQTGSPIEMPWLDKVDAVLQCWFAGQEVGNAFVDIINGSSTPSGKLPCTWWQRDHDSPSHGNFPTDEKMQLRYAEGLGMGYRARIYNEDFVSKSSSRAPVPLFPFGYGLSYTTFEVSGLRLGEKGDNDEIELQAEVTVRNSGVCPGSETVQIYIDGVLRGFQKAHLRPGETMQVQIPLDKYAFSQWDITRKAWILRAREYVISLQTDAERVLESQKYRVHKDLVWRGL